MTKYDLLSLIADLAEHLDGVTGASSRPDSDSGELVARARAVLASEGYSPPPQD